MINETRLNRIRDSLIISVQKTFEEMAFLEVLMFRENENSLPGNIRKSSIKLLEPIRACIIMEITEELLETMVENIYSKPVMEVSPGDVNDCLGEILNVLAGNFLVEFFGAKLSCKIELPEIILNGNAPEKQKIEIFFNSQDMPFRLVFIAEE